jgi:hypothetical protein
MSADAVIFERDPIVERRAVVACGDEFINKLALTP